MTKTMTVSELVGAVSQQPRFSLTHLPTPLEEAPMLSEQLGVRILVKRDDQTGLALGGNKARKLEFLIADALVNQADTVITMGGSQSNHARLTAAACRRAQLDCHLVLNRGIHPELQGNLLLDTLFGAQVHLSEGEEFSDLRADTEVLAERLRDQGRKPYIIPIGGSVPCGCVGYVAFVPEVLNQIDDLGIRATYLYLVAGSTGTQAGVLAGLTALGTSVRVQGISVASRRGTLIEQVGNLAMKTLEYLELPFAVSQAQIGVDDGYVGAGYGHMTTETHEAIRMAALGEGLILDPVYTGKAMAGLIAHAREGRFTSSDTVVFLHTGGTPAVFAYNREIAKALEGMAA